MLLQSIVLLCGLFLVGCEGSQDPIVEIALHPTKPHILYVATNAYIYKTRDAGKTWENISQGMSHSRVISLAIDPLFPANVYAGTKGDAIYKSYAGGQRWTSKRTGLDNVTITSVVHQIVFVPGSSNHLFAATSMGVYKSIDAGETWFKQMAGMIDVLMVVTLAIDPHDLQTLYAGTSGGVFKSTDQGAWWQKVNKGLVDPTILKSSRALNVTKIIIDPHDPKTVYAATLDGLYRTTNGAESWDHIGRSLPDHMFSDMLIDPFTPGTVYVSSRKGIHKSSDGGDTWQAINDGLASLNIRAMAISAQIPDTLYAGTNGTGLYRSQNGGTTWKSIPLNVRNSSFPPQENR